MLTLRGFRAVPGIQGLTGRGMVGLAIFLISSLTLQASDKQTNSAKRETTATSQTSAHSDNASRRLGTPAVAQAATRKPTTKPSPVEPKSSAQSTSKDELATLKERLAHQEELLTSQQQQIAKLVAALEEQKQVLERAVQNSPRSTPEAPNLGQVASLAPVIPAAVGASAAPSSTSVPLRMPGAASVTREELQGYTAKVDELGKSVDGVVKSLAGFKFSGDFRLRADGTYRSDNNIAGPVQNTRGRYRMRFYVDKALNDQFDFHVGLGSGRSDQGLTSDSDFTGFDQRAPLYIVEASAGYHSNQNFSLRGGKMPEVFADDSRFLFKEEIRLNGFQELVRRPFGSNALGITSIEFRGGQYILTNPNVQELPSAKACTAAKPQVLSSLPATIIPPATLPANCAYLNAGYAAGSNARDADLFHQGVVITGNLKPGWHHQFTGDLQLWRNQNQIALAATPSGFSVVLNPYQGLSLAGPITTGVGTATTTPGGAIFTAPRFQIAHVNYHVGYDGPKLRDREMPLTFDVHVSRNLGVGFLRDAVMGIASFGQIQKAGDVRLLYAYAIKDGNSMISEVTDDYVGSLSGVNIRTHEIRFDVGLNRFLAWQNYLYIVNPRRANEPALNFYVPVPAGANTLYRVQSQLQFKF